MRNLFHEPIWFSAQLFQPPTFPQYKGKSKVDIVIAGAGITGLSAAYHLLRAGYSVALFEKEKIGSGATGASTGILNQELDLDLTKLIECGRAQYAGAIRKFSEDSIQAVEDFVKIHNLLCDFKRVSTLTLVRDKDTLSKIAEAVTLQQSIGFNVKFLTREELRGRLAVNAWGAREDVNDAVIDPYSFVQQLARLVKSNGGLIYENTPVISYHENGPGVEFVTPHGVINSAYGITAWGASPKNLGLSYPIRTTVIATEPLTNEKLKSLRWQNGESLLDTYRIYHYARRTGDNRILFGGEDAGINGHVANKDLETAGMLRKSLVSLFPQLSDIKITHVWSGVFEQTADDLPYIKKEGKCGRILMAGGYGGSGIALGFMFGKEISQLTKNTYSPLEELFGLKKRNLLFKLSSSRFIPNIFKKSAVSLYLKYLHFRDFIQYRT